MGTIDEQRIVSDEIRKLADKIDSGEIQVIPRNIPDYNKFYNESGSSYFRESGFYTIEFQVYEENRKDK